MAAGGSSSSATVFKDDEGNTFLVQQKLAEGAQGLVYLAMVTSTVQSSELLSGQQVILKKPKITYFEGGDIKSDLSEYLREVQCLEREGTLLASKSPKESEMIEDELVDTFNVIPYFHGTSLEKAMYQTKLDDSGNEVGLGDKSTDFNGEIRDKIAYELLKQAYALHQRGLVHCDAKPDNIIVDTKTGQVDIVDLGQSFIASNGTPHPTLQSSTLYFPPEGDNNPSVANSFKTDMYTIGLVIASMYSKASYGRDGLQVAYKEGENLYLSQRGVLSDVLGPDVEHVEGMPNDLLKIVQHLTQPDPLLRPESIALANGVQESQSHALQDVKRVQENANQLRGQLIQIASTSSVPEDSRIASILRDTEDLRSVERQWVELQKETTLDPNERQFLQNYTKFIDQFCVNEGRNLHQLREHSIKYNASLEHSYTLAVKNFAEELQTLASEHKRQVEQKKQGSSSSSILSFSKKHETPSMQYDKVGTYLISASQMLRADPHFPNVQPDLVSRIIEQIKNKIGEEKGDPKIKAVREILEFRMKQLAPPSESKPSRSAPSISHR